MFFSSFDTYVLFLLFIIQFVSNFNYIKLVIKLEKPYNVNYTTMLRRRKV